VTVLLSENVLLCFYRSLERWGESVLEIGVASVEESVQMQDVNKDCRSIECGRGERERMGI